MIFLDTSALVKLVRPEAESEAVRGYVDASPGVMTSAITRVELPRAIRRLSPGLLTEAFRLAAAVTYVEFSDGLADSAATLEPATLRSLDALQLASALHVRRQITAFVAYDDRLLAAAETAGLPVERPS